MNFIYNRYYFKNLKINYFLFFYIDIIIIWTFFTYINYNKHKLTRLLSKFERLKRRRNIPLTTLRYKLYIKEGLK